MTSTTRSVTEVMPEQGFGFSAERLRPRNRLQRLAAAQNRIPERATRPRTAASVLRRSPVPAMGDAGVRGAWPWSASPGSGG